MARRFDRRRLPGLFVLVGSVCATASCGQAGDREEARPSVHSRSEALWNASDDVESPAASAVVKVGDCTGYAMTSQLILTAAHCVVPGDGGPPSIAKNTPVIVGANVGAGVQFLALDGGAYAFETVRDEEWMAAGAGAHLCP